MFPIWLKYRHVRRCASWNTPFEAKRKNKFKYKTLWTVADQYADTSETRDRLGPLGACVHSNLCVSTNQDGPDQSFSRPYGCMWGRWRRSYKLNKYLSPSVDNFWYFCHDYQGWIKTFNRHKHKLMWQNIKPHFSGMVFLRASNVIPDKKSQGGGSRREGVRGCKQPSILHKLQTCACFFSTGTWIKN